MPELANEKNFAALQAICSRDNFGARVLSDHLYDPEHRNSLVMTGKACAFSVKGNHATLCGIPDETDMDCLRFLGVQTVFLSDAAAERRKLKKINGGTVGTLKNPPSLQTETEAVTAETLKDIFPVLQYDLPKEERNPHGNWYVELSHKLRHGQCKIAAVRADGKVVSLAATVAFTDASAVIGCVRTDETYRGKGFASAVCARLGNELLSRGKQIYICCENERFSFYEKAGYIKSGQWWYCKL